MKNNSVYEFLSYLDSRIDHFDNEITNSLTLLSFESADFNAEMHAELKHLRKKYAETVLIDHMAEVDYCGSDEPREVVRTCNRCEKYIYEGEHYIYEFNTDTAFCSTECAASDVLDNIDLHVDVTTVIEDTAWEIASNFPTKEAKLNECE